MRHVLYFAQKINSFAGKILYVNLIGMILISLFESAAIFLLVPLIGLTGVINVHPEQIKALSWINRMFLTLPQNISLVMILLLYLLLVIGQSFFQRYQTILNGKIQLGYMLYLREETYKALIQANWGFFLKKRKSDIINAMTSEINRVMEGTQLFLQFIPSIVFTFIQIGIAFLLSAKMTLAILLFGTALIYFSRKFVKKSSLVGEETVQLGIAYSAGITDHFNGIKDIKSNTLEESHLAWIRSLCARMEQNVMQVIKLKTSSQFLFKVISAVLISSFVFFSIKMFQAQPAQLMLILVIFSRLWPRFSTIQSNLEQMGAVIPSFKHLMDLQNECMNAKEIRGEQHVSFESMQIKRGIECRDIYFRYNLNQPTFALHNINVYIPANQMTAIVGRSGAGKSTLIDLLMGLNMPESGQVLIDGNPLRTESLKSLRRSISYVPQDPYLFNASVRENLLMMAPNASEVQLWEALEFSSAAEFVKRLPQGLDTIVGDRGIRLSGGERQRLVLARAILRKPSILVLDEATSALDSENEAKIQKALDRIKGTMTILVIAHRLSTIRNADQVIVLDKGSIVQKGTYNHLAKEKGGLFSEFLGAQVLDSRVVVAT